MLRVLFSRKKKDYIFFSLYKTEMYNLRQALIGEGTTKSNKHTEIGNNVNGYIPFLEKLSNLGWCPSYRVSNFAGFTGI